MLPQQMLAVRSGGGTLIGVGMVPVPAPGKGEVLIRVAAAPINPSDLRFLAGSAAPPVVPGLEASGTVVSAGSGLLSRPLVGRRVAFASAKGGTWAEYAVSAAARCIPLRKNVSLEQAAALIVNPLTAMAFFEMVRQGGHTAIVNNAAASALGRMIVRLGRTTGVTVINVVRRQEQVDLLKALGAEYVLDSRGGDFPSALRELAHRLRATLVFDPVAGPEMQTLVDAVPPRSTIVVYAGLAGQPAVFNPLALAGDDKKIVGFYLGNWMARAGVFRMLAATRRVQRLIATDLRTTIQGRFPLSSAETALGVYRANMTAGKVLLVADPTQVPLDSAATTG